MLETITVNPNTRTSHILFYDHLDITGDRVVPLFGPNGVGKSTLIKQLEDRKDITIKTNGAPTKFYSYQNARDNFKIRQPRSYMESFDPGFMSARFSAQSISEGQSIIYSMFDLLDGLKANQPLAPEPGQDALILLDEIDSGLDVDAMQVVANVIKKEQSNGRGFLIISHYARLYDLIQPTRAVVMINGRIALDGGPEIFKRIDQTGYEFIKTEYGIEIEKEDQDMNKVSIGSCALKEAVK